MTAQRYDVVIVGAGPAGSATALALLARGARVALVERCRRHVDRLGESLRGVGAEALRELGVWDAFQGLEQRPSHYHRAHWAGRLEERHALGQRHGPDLHLDRARFDELLLEAAHTRGATVLRPATVREVSQRAPGVRVSLANGGETLEFDATSLVDATGRGATIARRLGARRQNIDHLVGVARTFARGAREPSTLVETADDGWWYSAPQPAGSMVALFVTDGDSPARHARHDDVWRRCLATAPLTRERLEGAEPLDRARTYHAAPSLLAWDPRGVILPVGDAALTFDPIAADGLCFALRSGLEAALALLGPPSLRAAYRTGISSVFREHVHRRELLYAGERAVRPTTFWRRARTAAASEAA